jgi:hypothetical protein
MGLERAMSYHPRLLALGEVHIHVNGRHPSCAIGNAFPSP